MLRKGIRAIAAALTALTALATLAAAAGCARRATTGGRGLTFATWGSLEEIQTLKPLLAEFERAHPDTPVTLVHVPDDYPHKLRLMAASGTMPDVVFLESQTMAGFAARGALRDLGPFLAREAPGAP